MTAADRSSPPVPAAEDDAARAEAERRYPADPSAPYRTREAMLSAFTEGWAAALDAAGVPALRAEVELLRDERDFWRDAGYARMDERDEARQQVADLRAERDALAHDLRRMNTLAGSGEQPGEGPRCPECGGINGTHGFVHTRYGNGGGGNRPCSHRPTPAVPDHSLNAVCLLDGCVAHGTATAPVVPDSAGLRERVQRITAWLDDDAALRIPDTEWGGTLYEDLRAVLAVVGQGVSAEQAWDEGRLAEQEYCSRQEDAYAAGQGVQIPRPTNPYKARPGCGCDLSGMVPPAVHLVDNHDDLPCPRCGGDHLRQDFTGSGRCHAPRPAPSTATEGESDE